MKAQVIVGLYVALVKATEAAKNQVKLAIEKEIKNTSVKIAKIRKSEAKNQRKMEIALNKIMQKTTEKTIINHNKVEAVEQEKKKLQGLL